MTSALRAFAGLDRVIHEPARLLILTMLYPVPSIEFLKLQKVLAYTQGNLSNHLAKLEAAGYVALEKKIQGQISIDDLQLDEKRARSIR